MDLKKLLFSKNYTEEEQEMFDFLRENILFRELTNKELSFIVPVIHERKFKMDEVVFFRQDPSQAVYILKEGKVKLYMSINDNEEDLIELTEGYIFGQNGLIEGGKRNYNALVTEDKTVLFVIPQVAILEVFKKHPQLESKIYKQLAKYYNDFIGTVFTKYRDNYGLFELNQIYDHAYIRKIKSLHHVE